MALRIVHRGVEVVVESDGYPEAAIAALVAEHGPWQPGKSRVERVERVEAAPPVPVRQNSSFGGQLVTDAAGKARVEQQQAALAAAGATLGGELYDRGTRMADVGYANQAARKAEYDNARPLHEAAGALIDRVRGEQRRNQVVSARDFAAHLSINGHLRFDGYRLGERAIRGLLGRLESPATSYVFGLRDRIADTPKEEPALREADKAMVLGVLQYEAKRNPTMELNLRLRDGLEHPDCFAVVSPSYGVADAPDVLPDALRAFERRASAGTRPKGSFSYDEDSTVWELRGRVWTPTPVDEQVVGEPFEGYASLFGRDDGGGRLGGGGGVLLLACLNAGLYAADLARTTRIHRSGVLRGLDALVHAATEAIRVMIQAWGTARADVIPVPVVEDKLVPIEEAIPGFFRGMLTARRGELVGVLPGRTEQHVAKLAMIYPHEARDRSQVTRADLAQSWTRHIQAQPQDVQLAAEQAIGAWMYRREPISYVGA